MIRIAVSAAIVIFVVFMLVWRTRIAANGRFFDNYFSVDQTRSIKGMCAVFILLSQVCMYLADTFPSLFLFKYVGAIMVAGFFFASGYGLQYGVMNKENYLKGFFSKKMLSLAVPYYIINFFYIVTNHMDIKTILASLFGYYLWFMMAIAIFYTGFFLCNKLFGKKWACVAMTVFVLCYIVVMNRLHFGFWWYNSCLAFAAGIWICQMKDSFTAFFKKHWGIKTLILTAVFAASYIYYCRHNHDETLLTLVISLINTTTFAVMLSVLSMKIQIKNPILYFCGGLSLELYLTHALWITWLRNGFWHNLAPSLLDKDAVYFFAILAGTVIMSVAVHIVSGFMLKAVRGISYKGLEKNAKI